MPATLKSLSKTWKEQLENLDKSTSKEREKEYYNQHAKPLKSLRIGDKVRIQDPATKKWDRCGDIVGIGKNRDYHVRLLSGRVLWRNRRFVKPAAIVSQEMEEDSENSARKVHFNDEVQDEAHTDQMAEWYGASASGSVDLGFDSESGQINDFNIGIHSFPA